MKTAAKIVGLCIGLCAIFCSYPLYAQQSFKTVQIGRQIWMAQNLDVDTFRNGDKIFQATNDDQWIDALKKHIPAWCYYECDPTNKEYGKLYNSYVVNDPRGLAPRGWHIPTYSRDDYWPPGITWHKLPDGRWYWQKTLANGKVETHITKQLPYYQMANLPPAQCEWNLLIDFWGTKPAYEPKGVSPDEVRTAGENLKSGDWGGFLGHPGNNSSGFTALPGGFCVYQETQHVRMGLRDGDPRKYEMRYSINWGSGKPGKVCAFWTANTGESINRHNWIVVLSSAYTGIREFDAYQSFPDHSFSGEIYGAYCRCIKD